MSRAPSSFERLVKLHGDCRHFSEVMILTSQAKIDINASNVLTENKNREIKPNGCGNDEIQLVSSQDK